MDELIAQVSSKVGIDADKAKTAIETVVNFLKTKLPGPIAAQIESALAGGTASEAIAKIDGLLGDKK